MSILELHDVSIRYILGDMKDIGLKEYVLKKIRRDFKVTEFWADRHISLALEKGDMLGIIGTNGAGKSTTIKMLTGILKPDSGNIKVSDFDPFSDRKKYVSNIGVVFGQKSQLWWDIPVIDSFDLLRDIYKIPKEEYEKTKNELIKMLDIKDFINTPVRQLSLGQRMRCEIAASLLHKPKILFLDEPTIGLDAVSKVQVRKFIKEINKKEKVTIILTSHDMSDIEALTNRVIVIGHGKKLYDGTLNGIKKKFSNKKKLEILFNKLNKIPKLKDVEIIEKKEHKIILDVDTSKNTISGIIEKFTGLCEIEDVNVINEDIDNIIVKLYQDLEL